MQKPTYKHIILRTLAIAFVFLSIFCNSTQNASADVGDKKRVVRMGYVSDYGIYKSSNGTLSGYVYDYITYIAKINNWQIQFVDCEWNEALTLLENGDIDILGPSQKTPERERVFAFHEIGVGYEYGSMYIKNDNTDIFYDDINSIRGKKIGVIKGSYYATALQDFLKSNSVEAEIIHVESLPELSNKFESGEIDIQVSSSMQAPNNSFLVLQFTVQEFYFPTSLNNTEILDGLNNAIVEIHRKDMYYDSKLYEKYYPDELSYNKAFTQSEYEFVKTAPVIKIGFDTDWEPFEYLVENQLEGIVVDVINSISRHSGLKFEFVYNQDYDTIFDSISTGELDIIASIPKSANIPEKFHVTLTTPIIETKLVFIVKQGYEFLSDKSTLVLPRDWKGTKELMEQNYSFAKVILADNIEQCLDMVMSGEAQLTVHNTLAADRLLKSYNYRSLSISSMSKSDYSVCMAVSDKSPEILLSILNKSISSIKKYELEQIVYAHTISIPYTPSFMEVLQYNFVACAIGLIIFFLGIFYLSMRTRKKLNKLAFYDELTGAMNLTKFKIEAEKLIARNKNSYAVAVVDIDKFKAVNDMYGYNFGDNILLKVVESLRSDVREGELLCRESADKFNLLIKYRSWSDCIRRFKKFSKGLENMNYSDTSVCKIVFSCGVYVIDENETNIHSIIDRAHLASKSVKKSYNSAIALYDKSMYEKLTEEKKIENIMYSALANNEFIIYLQPKIDLKTKQIAGAEALVRWINEEHGIILPSNFIPLFEENGFIIDLDFNVFEQVCKLLERWKREKRILIPISVNLSRRHLINQNTIGLLTKIISKYDVDPRYIEVELTESAFVDCDIQTITNLINDLHSEGFSVSVDDFGAGYSSLSLLKDLPIDVIKIDGSFFNFVHTTTSDKVRYLLESVISLSIKMNIRTVSEGVETIEQVHLLEELGCDLVQGYYFARPMTVEQVENDIARMRDYSE